MVVFTVLGTSFTQKDRHLHILLGQFRLMIVLT